MFSALSSSGPPPGLITPASFSEDRLFYETWEQLRIGRNVEPSTRQGGPAIWGSERRVTSSRFGVPGRAGTNCPLISSIYSRGEAMTGRQLEALVLLTTCRVAKPQAQILEEPRGAVRRV